MGVVLVKLFVKKLVRDWNMRKNDRRVLCPN